MTEGLRIIHVTDYYLPRLGGIEMQVHDLAAHQRAAGHHVEVWTSFDGPEEDGVRRRRRLDPALRRRLQRARPSVVHCHVSLYSPYASWAAHEAAAGGTPVLVTIHSMWSWLGPLPAMARALLRLRRWPIAWSAVSEAAAVPIRTMLGPGHPVHVLANSVDVASWSVTPDRAEVPTVVSVLRFARMKRPLPLLRMLGEVREQVPGPVPFRAVLIGDGRRLPAARAYADRHRMGSWVEMTGRLDREDIHKRLATASLFVAPATMESFGIAALEARAAGIPVVASSRGGVGEFITHGVDGALVDDDRAMVDALTRLLADPDGLAAMQAHCRRVPPHQDWVEGVEHALWLYAVAQRRAQ